jgi:hypothetical protein
MVENSKWGLVTARTKAYVALALNLSLLLMPSVVLGANPLRGTATSSSSASSTSGEPESKDATTGPPSPAHLIVGAAIKLPPALYLAKPHGPGALITPQQAQIVTRAMWNAWQTAINDNDTRALTQLAPPGPVLNGTIYNCAGTGTCQNPNLHPKMGIFMTAVPTQHSYPLYFLASIDTTNEVSNDGGPASIKPWMDVEILTKSSSSAPWQLRFQTGYTGTKRFPLPFLNFEDENIVLKTGQPVESYNPVPKTPSPAPPRDFISLLAAYWQSYKDVGHAPAQSKFEKGVLTSQDGVQYAENRNGSIFQGHRQTYQFSADNAAGMWSFSMLGGYAMECGTVEDDALLTPVKGELMNQNGDETNYGVPLAPGEYLKITTLADHETCVSDSNDGLYAAGDDEFDFKLTGELAPPQLVELNTAYGVMAEEITQYGLKYQSCTPKSEKCLKTLARADAEQFGNFANSVSQWSYPTGDDPDAHLLENTTRQLYEVFESIMDKSQPPSAETLSSITKSEKAMSSEYMALVRELSK